MNKKTAVRPKHIPKQQHCIEVSDINPQALGFVKTLQVHGFESYIVGGAVRDLLVGEKPKDFDIATAATPPQVRRLFPRSRIVGRRFKIVHLYHGRRRFPFEYIEASTFRSREDDAVCEDSGRILQDNRFGDVEGDAHRRDFTVNAFFYNPRDETILDYADGYADIRRKHLRLIGDPNRRLRQDPVRILRALRLSSKLNFRIHRETLKAISPHARLLSDINPSRLFDELVKTIKSRNSKDTFTAWRRYGVTEHIFPALSADSKILGEALSDGGRRFCAGKQVSVSFTVAAIFWEIVEKEWRKLRSDNMSPVVAMQQAVQSHFSAPDIIPRKIVARVMDIYFLYARLHLKIQKRRAMRIIEDPFIKRGIAFSALVEKDKSLAEWWRAFFQSNDRVREKMLLAEARQQ